MVLCRFALALPAADDAGALWLDARADCRQAAYAHLCRELLRFTLTLTTISMASMTAAALAAPARLIAALPLGDRPRYRRVSAAPDVARADGFATMIQRYQRRLSPALLRRCWRRMPAKSGGSRESSRHFLCFLGASEIAFLSLARPFRRRLRAAY